MRRDLHAEVSYSVHSLNAVCMCQLLDELGPAGGVRLHNSLTH